jgi:hypothetical protein
MIWSKPTRAGFILMLEGLIQMCPRVAWTVANQSGFQPLDTIQYKGLGNPYSQAPKSSDAIETDTEVQEYQHSETDVHLSPLFPTCPSLSTGLHFNPYGPYPSQFVPLKITHNIMPWKEEMISKDQCTWAMKCAVQCSQRPITSHDWRQEHANLFWLSSLQLDSTLQLFT